MIFTSSLSDINTPPKVYCSMFGFNLTLVVDGSDDEDTKTLDEFGSSIIMSWGVEVCFAPTIRTPVSGCSWYGP